MPQFLDVEAKIIGPVTARQFLIMVVVLILEFVLFRIFLNVLVLLAIGVPVLAFGIIFAFAKVNGQPFHYVALNYIQTFRRPTIRVWDKTMSLSDIRALLHKEPEKEEPKTPRKAPIEGTRLAELALVVNTGGVYSPEDDS